MADLAVLAEGFPVIGRHDDQRAGTVGLERGDDPSGLRIRFRHLVVVARLRRPAWPGGGIAVGSMRLEQVHPEKEALAAMAIEPGQRLVHDRAARPLVRGPSVRAPRHPIAVGLESLDQAEAAIERERRDECGRREARALQRVGQRRRRQIEPHPVVPGAVPGGIPARHQARVRGQRDRRRRERARESHALAREPIHRRRPRGGVAVGADAIGTQRIDGDEDEVACRARRGSRGRRLRRPAASCRREPGEKHRQVRTPR